MAAAASRAQPAAVHRPPRLPPQCPQTWSWRGWAAHCGSPPSASHGEPWPPALQPSTGAVRQNRKQRVAAGWATGGPGRRCVTPLRRMGWCIALLSKSGRRVQLPAGVQSEDWLSCNQLP